MQRHPAKKVELSLEADFVMGISEHVVYCRVLLESTPVYRKREKKSGLGSES
jgi:hypothetical protein